MAASRRGFLKGAAAIVASAVLPAAAGVPSGVCASAGHTVIHVYEYAWEPGMIVDDWRFIIRLVNIETESCEPL